MVVQSSRTDKLAKSAQNCTKPISTVIISNDDIKTSVKLFQTLPDEEKLLTPQESPNKVIELQVEIFVITVLSKSRALSNRPVLEKVHEY